MVPPERVLDPGGRDGCRAPIPWEREAPHGWRGAEPWLPLPPDRANAQRRRDARIRTRSSTSIGACSRAARVAGAAPGA